MASRSRPVFVFGSTAVAIYRLLQHQAFEPEVIAAMTAAYEDTLRALRLADRADPITEILAQRIIEFAQRGERDPVRLRDLVLQSLSST